MRDPVRMPADSEVVATHLQLGPPHRPGAMRRLLSGTAFRVVVYYLALGAIASLLISEFPLVRNALVTPSVPVLAEGEAVLRGQARPAPPDVAAALPPAGERAITTLLVVLGAIALALPVAWVYMLTKPLRFDPGLVRSIVILPIAVAGILLVVKHSLAIAFSLAGIVAAVRFRNTLKDPRDAVYIFLTIAIGIAAGVQALDVALVVSLAFNVAVFVLWKLHVGSLQTGSYARTGVISIGDPSVLVGGSAEVGERLRAHAFAAADGLSPDGILLVHTSHQEVTRHAVLDALRQHAAEWRALPVVDRSAGLATAPYLVELARKSDPADLLGLLDEWSSTVTGAEFIPFHARHRSEPAGGDEDDDE